jgi:K+-transporting ATPase KdpF subunit
LRGSIHARHLICRSCGAVFCRFAGISQKPATGFENTRWVMDFIIAGLAAVALFFYLLYALLKPERF